MKLYNPFKAHVVMVESNKYAVRKIRTAFYWSWCPVILICMIIDTLHDKDRSLLWMFKKYDRSDVWTVDRCGRNIFERLEQAKESAKYREARRNNGVFVSH